MEVVESRPNLGCVDWKAWLPRQTHGRVRMTRPRAATAGDPRPSGTRLVETTGDHRSQAVGGAKFAPCLHSSGARLSSESGTPADPALHAPERWRTPGPPVLGTHPPHVLMEATRAEGWFEALEESAVG